jgi:2-amino-4-hydroxy-6-hydroxymethyldihydropteridine diphosphokinase
MTRTFIALGSNVEPRQKYLISAVDQLGKLGTVSKIAPLYMSRAYGVQNQPDFYNSACILNTNILPLDLLKALKDIEAKIGRKRRFRWGPREIDLDIVLYGNTVINEEGLIIPHPEFRERRFVLLPLTKMDADFIPPEESRNLNELLRDCKDETHVRLEKDDWYP